MDEIRFAGTIRYWDPAKGSGLSVVDVPAQHIEPLGGLRQQRVSGTINSALFTSNVMPAGGGRLALSVSKAMMRSAGAGIGEPADIAILKIGRDEA